MYYKFLICRQLRRLEMILSVAIISICHIHNATAQTGDVSEEKSLANPIFAIKTNTLLWGGVTPGIDASYYFIPNGGVEFYFGRQWSANVDMAYTYKTYTDREELRALSAYTGEMRYWLKPNNGFRGFYAGLYGSVGDYDYQNNRSPDQNSFTNYTGKYWGTGLSAGYMLPIYRGFCLEAGVRAGYRHYYTNVYDREVSPEHNYYNYTNHDNQWELTSVYLNLVYRFGKKATGGMNR